MTIEEAIKRIEDHMKTHRIGEYPHLRLAESLNMAIAALLAQQTHAKLDRSRWEGCYWCTGFCPGVTGDTNWDYRFCPKCGRPITADAWAELERRMNGGTVD